MDYGFELLNGNGIVDGILYGGCIDTIYNAYTGTRFNGEFSCEPDIVNKYNLLSTLDEYKEMILFLEPSDSKPTPGELKEYLLEFKKRNILQYAKGILFDKPQEEKYYDEYKEIFREVF